MDITINSYGFITIVEKPDKSWDLSYLLGRKSNFSAFFLTQCAQSNSTCFWSKTHQIALYIEGDNIWQLVKERQKECNSIEGKDIDQTKEKIKVEGEKKKKKKKRLRKKAPK